MSSPRTQESDASVKATAPDAVQRGEAGRQAVDLGVWAPIVFFLLLILAFGLADPDTFLSTGNLQSILNNNAILAIIACGLTIVLLTGEFDLSVASAASFGGALAAVLVANKGVPTSVAILAVVAAGLAIGIVNGTLVTYFRIPALIATLGVASILDGLTQLITNNEIIFEGFSQTFLDIAGWTYADVQAPVYYLAIVAVILAALLRYTATGRHLHAVGGNREASRMAGIRVDRHVTLAFVASGLLGTIGGLMFTSRQGSLTPLFGTAFLLPAFAAAFLGSVTLRRGEFHILGTVIGVYLIGTGTTGLLIVGGPTYTQQLFSGAVLILATAGSRFFGRRAGDWRRQLGFGRRRPDETSRDAEAVGESAGKPLPAGSETTDE